MNEDNFLGELGLLLLIIILAIIIVPIVLGIGVAILTGAAGLTYFAIVISVAAIIWLMLISLVWV